MRDILEGPWRHVTSEGEHKSLINKGFIPLLIRRSLVLAQVEEPKVKPRPYKPRCYIKHSKGLFIFYLRCVM